MPSKIKTHTAPVFKVKTTGVKIRGALVTSEMVVELASVTVTPNGMLKFGYGKSRVFAKSMRRRTRNGYEMFVGEDGKHYTIDQIQIQE